MSENIYSSNALMGIAIQSSMPDAPEYVSGEKVILDQYTEVLR